MSDESSPVIARSKITYGRRARGTDAELLLADTSIVSTSSSVEEPPSSDGLDASSFMKGLEDDDDSSPKSPVHDNDGQMQDDEDVEAGTGRKFQYLWQEKLAAMDDSGDEEGQKMVKSYSKRRKALSTSKTVKARSESPVADGIDETVFTSPAVAGPSHPDAQVRSSLTNIPDSPIRRVRKVTRAVQSDSEDEGHPSSPQTPAHSLHHIHTPQKHSSPTPPTSTESAPKKDKTSASKISPPSFDEANSSSGGERAERRKGKGRQQPKKGKEKRMKAPTRKEREETEKTTARMKAAHTVEVPRAQTKQKTLHDLFDVVRRYQSATTAQPKEAPMILPPPSDDPIEPFSSSPRATGYPEDPPLRAMARPSKETKPIPSIPFSLSDSDEDMPELSEAIKKRDEQEEERERIARNAELLAERKRRALEQQVQLPRDEYSDDDIIVSNNMQSVTKDESDLRRHERSRVKGSSMRHRPPISGSKTRSNTLNLLSLVPAAAGAFDTPAKQKKGRGDYPAIRQGDLMKSLLQKHELEAQGDRVQKEAKWKSLGGKVQESHGARDTEALLGELDSVVERGLQVATAEEPGDEDEDTDGEYNEGDTGSGDEHGVQEGDLEEDVMMSTAREEAAKIADHEMGTDREPDEDEDVSLKRRARPRVSAVADSDDEENTNRGTSEDALENETDKENNAALMFDQGNDKENTVIHFSPSQTLLFRNAGIDRALSFSSDAGSSAEPAAARGPLRELSKDEDIFLTPSARMPPPATLSFDVDRGEGSSSSTPLSLKPAPILDGGFSELFDNSAEAGHSSRSAKSFSQFVTPAKDSRGFGGLRKADGVAFPLTLKASLQPALEVTDSVRKKADNIFEKEQGMMADDEVDENIDGSSPQMFVNENGFLTQTRPSNVDIARLMSSTQSSRIGISPSILDSVPSRSSLQRAPLRDIELDDLPGSDEPWSDTRPQGGRLKRRRSLSPVLGSTGGYRSSVSPSPSPIKRKAQETDAFQMMREAQKKKAIKKPKLDRSAFVDGQAEESDEDDRFGFGGKPKRRDEEEEEVDNEEELAKLQKEMMDDNAMDVSTLNEDMVLEKHREHVEADDAVAQKIAQDAATGKMRAKRRQAGLGFEDSDDSDEDDDNAARRHKLARQKRKLGDHDSLDALSKDEKSAPFLRAYEAGLEDDAQEFGYLEKDEAAAEDVVEPTRNEAEEDEDGEEQEVDEERHISMSELISQARKVAQGETTVNTIDPHDTRWMDLDDDDNAVGEDLQVKEVSRARAGRSARAADWDFEAGRLQLGGGSTRPGEALSRGTGMGRSVGGSAITGHTRTKRGGGSIVGQHGAGGSTTVKQSAKPVTRAPSKLSAVPTRRAKFAE